MIPEGFCDIKQQKTDENRILAHIRWNPTHDVFLGHFPGQPVVPGVLQMAIANQVLRNEFQKSVFLKSTGQIKFSAMIDPNIFPECHMDIAYNLVDETCSTTISIRSGDVVFLKMNATYITEGKF